MSDEQTAQLYLTAPAHPGLGEFGDVLSALLDGFDIACVRMGYSDASEGDLTRIADTLRPICHERDVPLVITDHFRLAAQLGLDGVHLSDGARQVRAARKVLSDDSIVGTYAHASRHDGMNAGEIGADYVSFGPLTPSSLGDGALAPFELFEWWSQLIEVPVVAEGGLTPEIAGRLARTTDFIALGEELWSHPGGAVEAMKTFTREITQHG
jgi:thiamine-phosphate pyrophosphorylase